jgi:hypothetical protein
MTHRTGSYSYNVICDICGFQYKSGELKKRWDGYMVCAADWEPRNILDFYQPTNDSHKLPYIRPDNNGIDVSPQGPLFCTIVRSQGRADIGTADCAKADYSN